MKKMSIVGTMGALLLSTAACSVNAPESEGGSDTDGIPSLGIARIEITDNAQETTVVGYADDSDNVVARMTLVHGRFALTGPFREEYNTTEVVGRSLDVDVRGQHLTWQTEGFTPTLHMPAHPASQTGIATFLDAPQVKTILGHWMIGFDGARVEDEISYGTGSFSGTNVTGCDGATTCGSARGLTINTCGGGAAASTASRAQMPNPAAAGTDQLKIAQCCPAGAGGIADPWFATKTCPLSGTTSECGTGTGACKGCATYSAMFGCSVTRDASNVYYSFPDNYLLTFTGFTLSNGGGGAYTSVVGGYPDDISASYGTKNTDNSYYRTDIGITVTARAFVGSNVVFISGACSGTGIGSTQCTIPAGAGNKSYSVRTSPF